MSPKPIKLEDLRTHLETLHLNGEYDRETYESLLADLPVWFQRSEYIIRQVRAHLTILVIQVSFLLPIGILGRSGWVLGNRLFYAIKRCQDRAKVHSMQVFLMSLVPSIGYFSYFLALKDKHPILAYAYLDCLVMRYRGKHVREYAQKLPAPIRDLFISRILTSPEGKNPESTESFKCES